MLDLRVLTNHWTEEGARAIFARLVTHCVKTHYPDAQSIRPNPGDDGIDTIAGQLKSKSKIYQAKFFSDKIDTSQKKQIRDSFKACIESTNIANMVSWTLCIPIEMSVDEKKWWDGWKSKQEKDHNVKITLWPLTEFERFYANATLTPLFDLATRKAQPGKTEEEILTLLTGSLLKPIVSLPEHSHLTEAVFVKKLEAADVKQHRSARTSFYNFELVRQSIEQGGSEAEKAELADLLERIYSLWETKFNKQAPDKLGKDFYVEVIDEITTKSTFLKNSLGFQDMHKHGGMHYWAEICEAGWTVDFKKIIEDYLKGQS